MPEAPPPHQLPACHGSLSERQQSPDQFDMPKWGRSMTAGELITLALQREGSREEALEMLSQTLADLGISGEEVAHYQKQPGICHDCNETDERNRNAWEAKLKTFSHRPISMHDTYLKKDGPPHQY